MSVWNDDYSRMESFDDHATSLPLLIKQLRYSTGQEFKETARVVCRRSRDLEFAVPRENVFGMARLGSVIEHLGSAVDLLKQWNATGHDADVASYCAHIESRIEFLKSRTTASVLATA